MSGSESVAPIRLGMVGGGQGAFIGAVHRIAARLDNRYRLVAGALASDPDRAHASARELGIAPERSYADYADMAQAEAERADGIEAVAIVTPNHLHYPVARVFLEAGIHVICDKPLTATLKDAKALVDLAEGAGRLFALTHNYTGYPMMRHARAMVAAGELGTIRVVQAEYAQDWLTERLEATGQKQAEWRTDPTRSGGGGCIGDIGTHAVNLAGFVSGLEIQELAADLTAFVDGRQLDDNAHILLRFAGGAKGMVWASQVAPGNENGLRLRVYGTKGGLEWEQEHPNHLWVTPFGAEKRLITRGGAGSGEEAAHVTRVPAGHPEGYLEGFATLYTEAADAIQTLEAGGALPDGFVLPTARDGLKGMQFVEACIRSSAANAAWIRLADL